MEIFILTLYRPNDSWKYASLPQSTRPGHEAPGNPPHLLIVKAFIHGSVSGEFGEDDGSLTPLACFGSVAGLGGGASTVVEE